MANSPEILNFSADRPITTLRADLLGRGQFAISLANAICAWNATESLVLAIYGPWGSGKSSVKNMILSMLSSTENAPSVIEFNPWEWSGENRLAEAFFDEIGTAIQLGAKVANAAELSEKWKRYSSRLALGGTALEHLKTAAEVCGIPWAPLIFGTVSNALKHSATVGDKVSEAYSAESEAESLADLKSTLADALSQLELPVLVVIDDLDRLDPEEIRTIFRLVKANADFPNLIYMLLFDRHIVENALDDASGDTGRNYMEKIVQAGFDLPQANQAALDVTLSKALDELLNSDAVKRTFDSQRWQNLYLNGLQHYCSSLRKIHRFVSSLSFQIGLYLRNSSLEVNIIDLIGVEALRVFEPALYHELRTSGPWLLRNTSFSMSGQAERHEKTDKIRGLLAFSIEPNRHAAEQVLRELFPQADWQLNGSGHGVGFEGGWLSNLRICHYEMFGRYFVMSIPKDDVSQSSLDIVIASSGDRDQLRTHLMRIIEEDQIISLLRRLESHKSTLDLAYAQTFVTALFDVGMTCRPNLVGSSV